MTWLGGGEAERDSGPDRTWLLDRNRRPGDLSNQSRA